ncbi:DUF4097 family beta strand repeat-containing protein [Haloplasma contractile]|uniref:DUF4097 domain-containing protein n=1 Tax=Haloplasma contractile SSD-17B TaxID=1033810 RepID=U2E7L6_9MOLU|nr:DUF4097 family beta strand repeat-containing protein [Haloplasma contractile]ERJ11193.1 hypothetical protein HLPCO_002762 [Haloplasma contractile SSD-17B]
MSKMSKIVIWLVGIMVISFVTAGVVFAATEGFKNSFGGVKTTQIIDEENTFKIEGLKQLDIESLSRDINFITVHDTDEIKVHYHGEITRFLGKSSYNYKAEVNEDRLIVDVESKSYGIIVNSNLKLDIYIPSSYAEEINIKSVSGDVNIENLNLTSLDIITTSGDIDLNDLAVSTTKIATVSGDLIFEDYDGNLDLKTTSGDIDINYSDVEFNNDLDIDTVSGDIEIYFPDGATFDLDMSTVSGDTKNELGFDPESTNKIKVKTVSGDLELLK